MKGDVTHIVSFPEDNFVSLRYFLPFPTSKAIGFPHPANPVARKRRRQTFERAATNVGDAIGVMQRDRSFQHAVIAQANRQAPIDFGLGQQRLLIIWQRTFPSIIESSVQLGSLSRGSDFFDQKLFSLILLFMLSFPFFELFITQQKLI